MSFTYLRYLGAHTEYSLRNTTPWTFRMSTKVTQSNVPRAAGNIWEAQYEERDERIDVGSCQECYRCAKVFPYGSTQIPTNKQTREDCCRKHTTQTHKPNNGDTADTVIQGGPKSLVS